MLPQTSPEAQTKYQLKLIYYPPGTDINQICSLIYGLADKNLMASLMSLPYSVGRSFTLPEAQGLSEGLKALGVGFSFKGASDEIRYDPRETNAQGKSNSTVSQTILSFRELLPSKKSVLLFVGIIALLIAGWFGITSISFSRLNITQNVQTSTLETAVTPKAVIEALENRVEFRRKKDVVWEGAEKSIALEENDSVRTYDQASAVLLYKEGSRVTVKANSILVIGNPDPDQTRTLKLENGSLAARINKGNLKIDTPQGQLTLSTKAGQSSSALETKMEGGKLTVAVTEGSAIFQSAKNPSAQVSVGAFEKVEATEESVSSPQAFSPQIQLISPIADATIQMDPNKATPIRFEWKSDIELANYRLILTSDSAGQVVLLTQESKESHLDLSYLDLGTLYWRVESQVGNQIFQSPLNKLYVQKHGK